MVCVFTWQIHFIKLMVALVEYVLLYAYTWNIHYIIKSVN
jgi:hypothetical protein